MTDANTDARAPREAAERGGAGEQRGPNADERIREAAMAVLKSDGYAGLTTAKVATRAGLNKAVVAYYFGSKQGLVAAIARQVSDTVVAEMLDALGEPGTAQELVEALTEGVWRVIERDQGLQRVYFDLVSQSVVEPEVDSVMAEMKEDFRAVLRELMRQLEDAPPDAELEAASIFLAAGVEGLALERLDQGSSEALDRAKGLFVESAARAIARRP